MTSFSKTLAAIADVSKPLGLVLFTAAWVLALGLSVSAVAIGWYIVLAWFLAP